LYEATFDPNAPGDGLFGGPDGILAPAPERPAGAAPAEHPIHARVRALLDPALPELERAQRVLDARDVDVLRLVMKDRSQSAFVLLDDPAAPGGVRLEENPFGGVDRRALERIAAIVALERLGARVALPELLLALDDRDRLVAVHAARALLKLGSRAGVPTLLSALDGKAYENEHAHRILRDLSGEDFGFATDGGLSRRAAAVARARAWWTEFAAGGKRLPGEGAPYRRGDDAEVDRRISAYVEVLGGFQFLYMEQARAMLSRLGPEAASFLRDALPKARGAAGATWRGGMAQVLGNVSGPEADALLAELRADDHSAVRARAVEASARRGGPAAIAIAAAALADRDPTVRTAAAEALGALGGPEAEAALSAAKAPEGGAVGAAISCALYRIRPTPERFAALEALVLGPSLAARTAAVDALNHVSGRKVLDDPQAPESELRAALEVWRAAAR
ncbi:MAG TPA: HEAT repeat domain-containing protein, partial [Planctomycetota bacterium]|nr:HEAT repeat domain-containing protein [Planctomycetota bacterium]